MDGTAKHVLKDTTGVRVRSRLDLPGIPALELTTRHCHRSQSRLTVPSGQLYSRLLEPRFKSLELLPVPPGDQDPQQSRFVRPRHSTRRSACAPSVRPGRCERHPTARRHDQATSPVTAGTTHTPSEKTVPTTWRSTRGSPSLDRPTQGPGGGRR